MLKLKMTKQFEKDLKLIKKRGYKIKKLETVVNTLLKGEQLDVKYKDHKLIGNYIGHRECHVIESVI